MRRHPERAPTGPRYSIAERHQPERQPRLALRAARRATQKTPETAIQIAMRWKLRYRAGMRPARHQTMKRLRPTCIATNASAKLSPRAPNASGIDIDMKSPSSIEA